MNLTPGPVPEEIQGARWPAFPVSYCVVEDEAGFVDSDQFAELVQGAFATWGAEVTPEALCTEQERGNGTNEIGWGRSDLPQPEATHGGAFQAGHTQQLFRTCPAECEGGAQSQIVEADILIEPEPEGPFRSEECLFSTLLHETGHFLGVPHLDPPAVMTRATNDCPQELTQSDREAYERLYEE